MPASKIINLGNAPPQAPFKIPKLDLSKINSDQEPPKPNVSEPFMQQQFDNESSISFHGSENAADPEVAYINEQYSNVNLNQESPLSSIHSKPKVPPFG